MKAHRNDQHGERYKCDFEGCDFEVERDPKHKKPWHMKRLNKHKEIHDTKTVCLDCKVDFLTPQQYKQHMKIEHPETLHEDEYTLCEICW